MITAIKEKAQNLIAGGFVTRAFFGEKSRFVKSSSSNKLHLVQTHNKFAVQGEQSFSPHCCNSI
jgi:hypothetical protein